MQFKITKYYNNFTELWHSSVWELFIWLILKDIVYSQKEKLLIFENIIFFKKVEDFNKDYIIFIKYNHYTIIYS